ncbi:MAG: DUF5717 family protein [Clostridiales bacterium]|nr:DUF5717 family protein [Clostridiales bacterium]
MELREQFEYPLPVLTVSTEKIQLEASQATEGGFVVKNTGGGLLSGQVFVIRPCLEFSPQRFEANEVKVVYRAAPDLELAEDEFVSEAVILSNGGEKRLPVSITFRSKSLLAKDKTVIDNLQDFAAYAQRLSPLTAGNSGGVSPAAELMRTTAFRAMLSRCHFMFMEAYENLLKDQDRNRALESFLILSGFKKPLKLTVMKRDFIFKVKSAQRDLMYAQIPVRKEGWGYLEDSVCLKGGAPWLKILTSLSQALKGAEQGAIAFSIDPALLPARCNTAKILVTDDPENHAAVTVVREPAIKVRASKEVYGVEEEGKLCLENQSGEDLLVEIQSSEKFVRFEAKKYIIAEYAEIPFTIKMAAMQSLSLRNLRKQPPLPAIIEARAKGMTRRVKIYVGAWL